MSTTQTEYKLFPPCRGRRACSECTGAYFDQETGDRVACRCSCHKQGELLAEYKPESKQRKLF
jgi:hypothetical protein